MPGTVPPPTASPPGPDVPTVVTGDLIEASWGIAVADDLAELWGGLNGHLADTVDAHDASAISVVPTGGITTSTVQDALAQIDSHVVAVGAPLRWPVIASTANNFQPEGTHENTRVTISNAGSNTITLPGTSAFSQIPVGAVIEFMWLGAGQPSFIGAGATVLGTPGVRMRAQYSVATAKKIAANTWSVSGDLSSTEIPTPSGDELLESFTTLAKWVAAGAPSPSTVSGRTGLAAQLIGTSAQLTHTFVAANESPSVFVGAAVNIQSLTGNQNLFEFRSDAGATLHGRVVATTNGQLIMSLGDGTFPPTLMSTPGVVIQGTWQYIEVWYVLGDSNGGAVARVNGIERFNVFGIDTKNAGTKTGYDTLRLPAPNATTGGTVLFDDLYITTGAGAGFKGDIQIP